MTITAVHGPAVEKACSVWNRTSQKGLLHFPSHPVSSSGGLRGLSAPASRATAMALMAPQTP